MPFGGAQVIIQLVDYDAGDESFYGDYRQMYEFLQTRLVSFKVKDRDRGKDRLEMTFRNDDYEMIDSPVFAKGQKLLTTWGWPGEMVVPRRFIVQSVKGGNQIVVAGHCRLSIMDTEKRSRLMENVTHSEFVRAVVEEYGYTGSFQWIEDTKIRCDVSQANMTDARMLHRLARLNGFVFYDDATGIHWHKRNMQAEPVRWFVFRQDEGRGDIIKAPTFDINMSRGIAKVKVTYRDPRTKEYGEAFAGPDDTELDSLGEESEIGNPDDSNQGRRAARVSRIDTRYGGLMTKEEAQVEANARYYETAGGRYKMETEIIGSRLVSAKNIVGFAGISDMLDGLYYISEAEHVVAGGKWTIALKCRKNAVNRIKVAKAAKKATKEKINPEVVRLEDSIIIGEVPQLKKTVKLTTDSQGNVVPAYYFTDGDGYSGPLTTMKPEEILSLNEKTLQDLYQLGGQSAEPDSAA